MPARYGRPARANRRLACVAVLAIGLSGLVPSAHATFYQVNSTADVPDANTATAACETATGNGVCTLRAAVQQANAHAGLDTILLPANTFVLSRVGSGSDAGDLDVTGDITIIGAGAASTIIDGNGAATGDGVFQFVGSITASLNKLTIRNGVGPLKGGGIASEAHLTVDSCVITGNSVASSDNVAQGGGIDNTGSLVLKNSIVSDNAITRNGPIGGIGGGIHSSGPLTISNSTISGNASGYGGGLYAETQADVVVTNSTFSGNSALFGGGIYTTEATTTLVNDTISGNSSYADGGGIFATSGIASPGVVGLYSVTVAANVANADNSGGGAGAGIYNIGASVTLDNSILSGNSYRSGLFFVLADCAGTFASSSDNIVTHPSCTINGPHSSAAPMLGPLQDNGGPTPTHALLPGSPAVDAGGTCFDAIGAPLGMDQRGVPRPQGAACDIGAFELEDLLFADGFEPGA